MDIDWLILADAAQIVGGKLFLMGGGWDVLSVNSGFPSRQRCALAAAFRVPWNETNVRHDFRIRILDEDHTTTLFEVAGELELGRPPGLPPGQEQRAQTAVDVEVTFERPGRYVVIATIDEVERRAVFSVIAMPSLPQRPFGGQGAG